MKKYPNMYELLQCEARAKDYFDHLPAHVQDQIETRFQSVNSFESLQDYAQNLLRADD